MLDAELRGVDISKTDHRRRLMSLLKGRSPGSVERKHQNISAILIQLGFPYISGYKPLANYQQLLREEISARLVHEKALVELVSNQVERPAETPKIVDILATLVSPPESGQVPLGRKGERGASFHSHP